MNGEKLGGAMTEAENSVPVPFPIVQSILETPTASHR
jgi:hypothetical protein